MSEEASQALYKRLTWLLQLRPIVEQYQQLETELVELMQAAGVSELSITGLGRIKKVEGEAAEVSVEPLSQLKPFI